MFQLSKFLNNKNKNFIKLLTKNNEKLTVIVKLNASNKSNQKLSKKDEDQLKNKLNFYIENELPDKELENQLKTLKSSIKSQADLVRSLKNEKAPTNKINKAVEELLIKKTIFQKKIEKILQEEIDSNQSQPETDKNMTELQKLLKERFFYYQSFSIYGGVSGLFDVGPLGCLMQNNLVDNWKKHFIINDKMLQIDCSILTPEIVLKASGHLSKFSDIMVKDVKTNETYRVDHLLKSEIKNILMNSKSSNKNLEDVMKKIENSELVELNEIDDLIKKFKIKSPNGNDLSNVVQFNLMFKTEIGSKGNQGYMRPETAQGIFMNFKRLYEFNQRKLPLIVAQIGKSFRNEINPKSGLIRQREFLMAEIEHFMDPALKNVSYEKFKSVENEEINILDEKSQRNSQNFTSMRLKEAIDKQIIKNETVAYYIGRAHKFCIDSGIDKKKIRFRQHLTNEMAHYANECWDLECLTSLGWIECAGIADRSDYDLKQHSSHSGLNFFAEKFLKIESDNKKLTETFVPHVIEPSFGIGRLMYTILEHNFKIRSDNTKYFLSLPYSIAPYKCCILPLKESDQKFQPFLKQISDKLTKSNIVHKIDDFSGAIGRRYWRSDECGTPFVITVDYKTMNDNTVTIRERDSTEQIRINIDEIGIFFKSFEEKELTWEDLKN